MARMARWLQPRNNCFMSLLGALGRQTDYALGFFYRQFCNSVRRESRLTLMVLGKLFTMEHQINTLDGMHKYAA